LAVAAGDPVGKRESPEDAVGAAGVGVGSAGGAAAGDEGGLPRDECRKFGVGLVEQHGGRSFPLFPAGRIEIVLEHGMGGGCGTGGLGRRAPSGKQADDQR